MPNDNGKFVNGGTGVGGSVGALLGQPGPGTSVSAPSVSQAGGTGTSVQTSVQDQLSSLLKSLSYQDVTGAGATKTGEQINSLLSQLPYSEAQKYLKQIPTGTPLYTAVTSPSSSTPTQSTTPTWDPLALQTMWASVFGPVFNQVAKLNQGSGSDYLSAMQQAIGGSNQSAGAKQQQEGAANAMSQLIGQNASAQVGQVGAAPTYDNLIQALQLASGAATQYQGEAQKAIAYNTNTNAAAAFNPALSGSGTSGTASTLTPTQAAAALNSAISGNTSASSLLPTSPSNSATSFSLP